MIKRLSMIGTLMFLGMGGCQTGLGIISYDRGTAPVVAQATEDGEYALFSGSEMDPKVSYYLHRGDALGFKSGKTGEIIAVAGKAEVSEPDGTYVWRRRTGQEGQGPSNPLMGNSNSGSSTAH
jgi:hypothetical protein